MNHNEFTQIIEDHISRAQGKIAIKKMKQYIGDIELDDEIRLELKKQITLVEGQLAAYEKNKLNLTSEQASGQFIKILEQILNLVHGCEPFITLPNSVKEEYLSKSESIDLSIVMKLRQKDWTPNRRARFLAELSSYLGIKNDLIRIKEVKFGSVILTLELPESMGEKLVHDYKSKNTKLIPLIRLHGIEDIKALEFNFEKTEQLEKLIELPLTIKIQILRDTVGEDKTHSIQIRSLIQKLLQIDNFDKNSDLEQIKHLNEKTNIENLADQLAKIIFKKYNIPELNINKRIIKWSDIAHVEEIINQRLKNGDISGALELLQAVLKNQEEILEYQARYEIYLKGFSTGHISDQEFNKAKGFLSKDIHQFLDNLKKNPPNEKKVHFITGTWRLELSENGEFFILNLGQNQNVKGRKKVDITTRFRFDTHNKWLKEIDTRIPKFSISVQGKWNHKSQELFIYLQYSIHNLIGSKAQKLISNAIGGLISRTFIINTSTKNTRNQYVGSELGVEDSVVTFEAIMS